MLYKMSDTPPTYYQLNREKRLEYARAYNLKNKESIKLKSLAYQKKNRLAKIEYSRKYNALHREELNKKAREKNEAKRDALKQKDI